MNILRKTFAVILGLVAGMTTITLTQMVITRIYGSVPVDSSPEELRKFIDSLPLGAFLMVLVSHQSGSFVASAVATLVAGHRWLAGALGLGVVYLLAGIANASMIPVPAWFIVVDLLLYIPAALAGCYVASMLLRTCASSPRGRCGRCRW